MANPVKVFISYSHDSSEHEQHVRGLGASLSRNGCECNIDVYKNTGEDWPTWMSRQLIEADFILCVITKTYERRFRDLELPDQGFGVGWEAVLIRRLLYSKKLHNERIFPIAFAGTDREYIPLELQGYDSFILDEPEGYLAILRKIHKQPVYSEPITGTPPAIATSESAPMFSRPCESKSPSTTFEADISRILKYAPAELIGREEEIRLLNETWAKIYRNEKGGPRILTLVALGGEGKTSLVAKWAAELAAQNWLGCDAAFAWSFYSQGIREQQATSSDLFLKEALNFFGDDSDKDFAASSAGMLEKAQRLIRVVGQRHSLLILDGLEPLQHAPSSPSPGELKDEGIAALLKGLATNSCGLCVITTRYSLPDLRAFWQTTVLEERLKRLSRDAGVNLLKILGVKGSELRNVSHKDSCKKNERVNEFEKLVEDVKGHALTLTLFGSFLNRAFNGDIRQRNRVRFEKADWKIDGGHAFRTMAAYEQWLLRDGFEEGKREVAVLRLMGLFDRPADANCLRALLQPPPILGLTEPLIGLEEDDWEFCLSGLEIAKLITVNRDASKNQQLSVRNLQTLDAHPHLREYFAKQLREMKTGTWRDAHRRLYKHLCNHKEGKQPTLEDLQPLYQAVSHGCQAGMQQTVFTETYWSRIQRKKSYYPTKQLGAIGAELSCISAFFIVPWVKLNEQLSRKASYQILDGATEYLHTLGRVEEAWDVAALLLKRSLNANRWDEAASGAILLSEISISRGLVRSAMDYAIQAVELADRCREVFYTKMAQVCLAIALHHKGEFSNAEKAFAEAEKIQNITKSSDTFLLSLQGCDYCELLLDMAEDTEESNRRRIIHNIRTRIQVCINHASSNKNLLPLALAQLASVRCDLLENQEKDNSQLRVSVELLSNVINQLRHIDALRFICRAFLIRARVKSYLGDVDGARSDLDEAFDIASRGPLRLYLVDVHLQKAHLFSDRSELEKARMLIASSEYGRREPQFSHLLKTLDS